jgi:hypothetical protein
VKNARLRNSRRNTDSSRCLRMLMATVTWVNPLVYSRRHCPTSEIGGLCETRDARVREIAPAMNGDESRGKPQRRKGSRLAP